MLHTRSELASTIHLDGPLAAKYGDTFEISVGSASEAVDAMNVRHPGFLTELFLAAQRGEYYDLEIDGSSVGDALDFKVPRERAAVYRFVLVPSGGILSIAALTPVLLLKIVIYAALIGLTLYSLIAKPPKRDEEEDAPGSGFDGATNLASPGVPVPIIYGETLAGSVMISGFLIADGAELSGSVERLERENQAEIAKVEASWDRNRDQNRPGLSKQQLVDLVLGIPKTIGDHLSQSQFLRVIDLISEGPIEGFVEGEAIAKTFLDETPLSQFSGAGLEWRAGSQVQPPLALYTGDSSVTAVNVSTHQETGWVERSITQLPNRIFINLSINSLLWQGSTAPTMNTISFEMEVIDSSAVLAGPIPDGNRINRKRSIKALVMNRRNVTEEIEIPSSWTAPLTVRVRKNSDDSGGKTQSVMSWDSFSVVGDSSFLYPYSAIVGSSYHSEEFSGRLPKRSFLVKGRKVRIPDNYQGTARTYSTTEWNGSFNSLESWTNNPAWIILDYITNRRYGMGIADANVDLWSLYECARRCDELVTSPGVDEEFRYSMDVQMQKQRDSWTLLVEMCATMEAKPWWDGQKIRFSQDRPTDQVWQFGPENVVDGEFQYTQTALSKRHNRVTVAWNDPTNFFRRDQRSADDQASIFALGFHERRSQPIGVKFPGQAMRLARSILETEKLDEVVKFRTGTEAVPILPGTVFGVSDPARQDGLDTGRGTLTYSGGILRLYPDIDIVLPVDSNGGNYKIKMLLNAAEDALTAPGDTDTLTITEDPANDNYRLIQVQCDLDDDGDFETDREVIGYDSGTKVVTLKPIAATSSTRDYRVGFMRQEMERFVAASMSAGSHNPLILSGADAEEHPDAGLWTLLKLDEATELTEWRCISMEDVGLNAIEITGAKYNSSKYAAVDSHRSSTPPVSQFPVGSIVPPPFGIFVTLEARPSASGGGSTVYFLVQWGAPRNDLGHNLDFIAGFRVAVRRHDRTGEDIIPLQRGVMLEWPVHEYGDYTFEVRSVEAATGRLSEAVYATIQYNSGSLPRPMLAIEGLHVIGSDDNTWTGPGFSIGWRLAVLGVMEFGDVAIPAMSTGADGGLVVLGRTEHDPVPLPGAITASGYQVTLYADSLDGRGYAERHRNPNVSSMKYAIDYALNARMSAGPFNDMMIGVSAIDHYGRISDEVKIHVTNVAPAAPLLLSVDQFVTELRWSFAVPDDAEGMVMWWKEASTINDTTDLTEASVIASGSAWSFSIPVKANTQYAFRWAAYDSFQARDPDLLNWHANTIRSVSYTFTTLSFDLGQAAIDALALQADSVLPEHVRAWLIEDSGEVFPVTPDEGDFFWQYTIVDGAPTGGTAYRYDGTSPYDEAGWIAKSGARNQYNETIVGDTLAQRTIFTEKLVVGDFFNHAIDHNWDWHITNGALVGYLHEKGAAGPWVDFLEPGPIPTYSGLGYLHVDHALVVSAIQTYRMTQGFPIADASDKFSGITCSEGDVFHFQYRLYSTVLSGDLSPFTNFHAELIFEKSDGSFTTVTGAGVIDLAEDWTTIVFVDGTAPQDAVRVRCSLLIDDETDSVWVAADSFIDDFQFRKKTGTAYIEDLAVGTAQIQDLAVGTAQIDDLAVTTAQIKDLAVTSAKFDTIAGDKIDVGTLDADRIIAGNIHADRIVVGSRDNLIQDPAFDNLPIGDWFVAEGGGGTWSIESTPDPRTGVLAAQFHVDTQLTAAFLGANSPVIGGSPSAAHGHPVAYEGQSFYWEFYHRWSNTTPGANKVRAGIAFYESDGTQIEVHESGFATTPATYTDGLVFAFGTAPVLSAYVIFYIKIDPGAAAATRYHFDTLFAGKQIDKNLVVSQSLLSFDDVAPASYASPSTGLSLGRNWTGWFPCASITFENVEDGGVLIAFSGQAGVSSGGGEASWEAYKIRVLRGTTVVSNENWFGTGGLTVSGTVWANGKLHILAYDTGGAGDTVYNVEVAYDMDVGSSGQFTFRMQTQSLDVTNFKKTGEIPP